MNGGRGGLYTIPRAHEFRWPLEREQNIVRGTAFTLASENPLPKEANITKALPPRARGRKYSRRYTMKASAVKITRSKERGEEQKVVARAEKRLNKEI